MPFHVSCENIWTRWLLLFWRRNFPSGVFNVTEGGTGVLLRSNHFWWFWEHPYPYYLSFQLPENIQNKINFTNVFTKNKNSETITSTSCLASWSVKFSFWKWPKKWTNASIGITRVLKIVLLMMKWIRYSEQQSTKLFSLFESCKNAALLVIYQLSTRCSVWRGIINWSEWIHNNLKTKVNKSMN